jgi:cbb3-type cytochrome oxidase maturation protein
MESLFLLIPLSVALVLLIGWVFRRALEGGQFDDLDRHGHSVFEAEEAERGRRFDLNQDSHPPRP